MPRQLLHVGWAPCISSFFCTMQNWHYFLQAPWKEKCILEECEDWSKAHWSQWKSFHWLKWDLNQTLNEERRTLEFWAKEIIPLGVAWKNTWRWEHLKKTKGAENLALATAAVFLEVIKTDGLSLLQTHPPQSRLICSCVRNISSTYETNLLVFFLHLCFTSKLTITMEMTQCCQLLPECHLIYHRQFQISGYPTFPFLSIP